MSFEAATKTLEAHIHTYATEVNKTFGNATVLSIRVGGLWEPNLVTGPLTGDLVTPNHTDNLTGLSTQGPLQIGRTVVRRDQQAVKLERYLSRAGMTHTFRTGLQFEEVNDLRQTAWPSNVQYNDFGGAPDYALFRDPSSQGAAYTTQGVWAEDQLTLGDRVTLDLGIRFDRMHAVSNDLPAINSTLEETGSTIPGLGSLFTWKLWAPRVGVNFKLTGDGQTVLRSTYGRAYRQILPFELDLIHPGISSVTQARFVPATGGYTQIVSVTNSRSNLAVDPNLTAPRQDTFSVGVDRQLMPQVAVNASYVYKHGENLVGWKDIRGIYGQGTTVLPDGRSLATAPLLSPTSQRLFQWTNRSDYVDNYHGFVASLVKRMSHRWHGQVNLTLSKSEGLRSTTPPTFGQDPNDLTNALGRLTDTDRPVMFTANGSYDIPRIDVRVSGNYQNLSGRTFAPFASVVLPQGRRDIKIEAAGDPDAFRAPRTSVLNLRIDKMLSFGGPSQARADCQRRECAAEHGAEYQFRDVQLFQRHLRAADVVGSAAAAVSGSAGEFLKASRYTNVRSVPCRVGQSAAVHPERIACRCPTSSEGHRMRVWSKRVNLAIGGAAVVWLITSACGGRPGGASRHGRVTSETADRVGDRADLGTGLQERPGAQGDSGR